MKKLASAFLMLAVFLTMNTLTYADPTKDKNAGQEIAEKFITLIFDGNFQEAARLVEDEKDPAALKQSAETLKANFDLAGANWQKRYNENFAGAVLNSRTLAPQTLVSSRRGDDGKKFSVLVYFTEDHAVLMPGKQKPWHFYWHHEAMLEITDGKIANVVNAATPENLMILKPENCVRPAVC